VITSESIVGVILRHLVSMHERRFMLQRRKDFAVGQPVIEDGADVIGVRLCRDKRSKALLVSA